MQSVSSNAVAQALSWQTPNLAQALVDFGFQLNTGYSGTFGINIYAKTNNLLIVGVEFTNLAGTNIGTRSTAVVGTCNIRPKNGVGTYGVTTTAIDYTKTSTQIRLGLMTDGRFCFFESVGVTSGSNAIMACLVIPI